MGFRPGHNVSHHLVIKVLFNPWTLTLYRAYVSGAALPLFSDSRSLLPAGLELNNLKLKSSAFDELDLPIRIVEGHIGALKVQLPWTILSSRPLIVEM